jgi:hypothetical protein
VDQAEITKRFTSHAPRSQATVEAHVMAREVFGKLAAVLNELLPESREKSLAFTALEEALMWSNAAIARNQS